MNLYTSMSKILGEELGNITIIEALENAKINLLPYSRANPNIDLAYEQVSNVIRALEKLEDEE